ncbi:hypothetical protein [Cellvibrio sp. pealriver]|uniref:hypothetical protein n=1 Tax=Cellvibrio sp. pealriver TaxID=1622269 RepID=UPI00066FE926|nr:hypothetical protein [Cellvibrio sp. pealriver]
MHTQKKLGIGFIFFGFLLIVAMYFVADGGAFVFTALLGLMAIFFGAFQLMIINSGIPAKSALGKTAHKAKSRKAHS